MTVTGTRWRVGSNLMRATVVVAIFVSSMALFAQEPGGQGATTGSSSAKASAPSDLTGYWVSVVNSAWRWRMLMPAKGDFGGVPFNAQAKKIGDAWDPAKDEAAGEQCRGYGAAGLMRIPERLHITWQDENTLKVETDAGMQTRLLHFNPPSASSAAAKPTWQGESAARWDWAVGTLVADPGEARFGSLHVVTTRMRPGYLRRNGLPYSANTVLTEDWDVLKEADGTEWLVISTTIDDPTYLKESWRTTPAFKREPNGSKWDPSPCSARW